jgi:hypothetical protein
MKNEPIIAYNHLQEEENEESITMQHSHASSKGNWKILFNPFAIAIEIAAILAMAFFMIKEIIH